MTEAFTNPSFWIRCLVRPGKQLIADLNFKKLKWWSKSTFQQSRVTWNTSYHRT